MQEPSESGTRKIVPHSQHDLEDKGKAKMIKPEKPLKKKDQIKFDEEVAKRLEEELEAELKEEERVARQREYEANLISWDNTQAMMEADYDLAQRLQVEEQGELTTKERSTITTTTTTIPSKDKGKGIMVKEPLKMKKKDQINFDEHEAIRLQAEFDEGIDADYEIAKQIQAEEQEELSIEEKLKLFVQLLEARKKNFAAKRAEEKRNKPSTRAQQRSIMYMDTELVEGSQQKVDEDKEIAKLQSLVEVIPDEEEVATDAIPLATKPPSIMLRSFDMEDLETLWKLVKAKHGSIRPEESYERVL
ncbi:hypothetical protein Tco_0226908 [Tanacetum coccineum]